jgi:hypothetical protein
MTAMIASDWRYNVARRIAFAVCVIATASGIAASASEQAAALPADSAPAITLDALLVGIAAHEAALDNLSCAVGYVAKRYYADQTKRPFKHDAGEVRIMGIGNWIVASSGKSWCKRTGKTTYLLADGSELAETFESEATFDGNLGRHVHVRIGADGFRYPVGMISDGFVDEGPSPLEYTTHWLRWSVSRALSQRSPHLVDPQAWDGRRVVVAETAPVKNGQEYKTQFWIDPARGFIVVRRLGLVRYAAEKPWRVNEDVGSLAHREIAPGIWLPEKFESKVFTVPASEPAELQLAEEVKGRLSEWQVNQPVSDAQFKLEFPPELRSRGIRFFPGPGRT